jgi:hypothetical protein
VALSEFTTFGDVRASLGVTSDELDDATLSLRLYDFSLRADLDSLSLDLIPTFRSLAELTDPSEDEIRFLEMVQLFATYSVAHQLISSLPMFAFKEVSDGKASDVRFSQDPYKATIEKVEALYGMYRTQIVERLAAVNGVPVTTAPVRVYLAVSSPARDPVTGT